MIGPLLSDRMPLDTLSRCEHAADPEDEHDLRTADPFRPIPRCNGSRIVIRNGAPACSPTGRAGRASHTEAECSAVHRCERPLNLSLTRCADVSETA